MEITENISEYSAAIMELAYQKYAAEAKYHTWLPQRTKQSFEQFFLKSIDEINGIVGIEEEKVCGFLLYTLREEGEIYCDIPVWGYGGSDKESVKVMSRLFQHLAEKIVLNKKVCFSVRLYAHDVEMQKLFSFMQFGVQSEKGIRCMEEMVYSLKYEVRELSKKEVQQQWKEIWELLSCLVAHLQKSPVFYLGYEFTEDSYKAFFTDSETRVFAAFDEDNIIGLIQANVEEVWYFSPDIQAVNVGEIYVKPEYRGKKIAQALLHYVDIKLKAKGVDYEWVEHGTANPTARGFWNKYFAAFEYELIRVVEGISIKM